MARNALAYALEKGVRRLSVKLTPPWRGKDRALALHLRRVFAQQEIDCVIDVGANRGQYYRFLRYWVGFRGLVVSFEPIPELAADLADRARLEKNWLIKPCALGAQAATLKLNVMAQHSFSSVLTPDRSATRAFAEKNTVSKVIDVPVCSLDSAYREFAREHGISRPYLKLDTQGYDLEVLTGAHDTLAQVRALQSELSFKALYAGMPSWRTSLDTIAGLGFDVGNIFPLTQDAEHRLIEADCVFVRRNAEARQG
jgi:FkbM family methyltransferase